MKQRFGFSSKSKRLAVVIAGLLVFSVVGVALAAALTIDTFNTGALSLSVFLDDPQNPATEYASGLSVTGVALGGDREMTLQWIGGGGASASLETDFANSNRLAFAEGDGITARGVVRWDGTGNSADTNDQGLSNVDLTQTGTNDGFHFEVVNDDLPATIRFRVYSSASNWSVYVLNLPGGIISPAHVDFFVPFASFSTGGSGPANFASVTSIEIEIDGTVTAGADVSIDFADADNFREYGDLPTAPYGATIVNTYQVPQGQRLGRNVDVEVASQPDVPAGTTTSGDDSATLPSVDDEDGVRPTPGQGPWIANGSGTIDVSYAGCTSNCYLNGWIDWDNNGDFAGTGEQVFSDVVLTASAAQITQTLNITIGPDAALSNAQRYARFRICPTIDTCDQASGQNGAIGEIEDYRWTYGPLAVTLNNLEATADTQNNTAALVLAATVVVALGLAGMALRRRTA